VKQAIVILHARGENKWLQPLLDSIQTHYPIIVTNHDPEIWCMGAIKQVFENTNFDEILILNESMIVKNNLIWELCFSDNKGKPCMLAENYLMFLGKFNRNIPPIPTVKNKREDVLLGEGSWCIEYKDLNPDYVAIQPLKDTQVFTEIHGQKRMVLENDYFIKYKGTWDITMIP
jgi:hypothetical protein